MTSELVGAYDFQSPRGDTRRCRGSLVLAVAEASRMDALARQRCGKFDILDE